MSSPGSIRFGQIATTPSPPPAGYDLIYVKTDDILYIQDSTGTEIALGSSASITSLTGEVTATGPGSAVATVSNSAVIGKVLTGFTSGPNSTVLSTDTILQAFQKLQAQVTASSGSAITALTGDVSATGPGSASATVNSVGGKTSSDIASAVTTVDAATSSNTASTLVERDASGNFSANIITASLSGNATTSTTSTNFSGALTGDVTGTQSATSVFAIDGTVVAGTTGTGNVVFSASPTLTGTITASAANFSGAISASNFSGSSSGTNTGDVTVTNTNSVDLAFTSGQTGLTANLNLSAASASANNQLANTSVVSDGLLIQVPYATAVNVGTTNLPGSSTSFSLADHVHALTAPVTTGQLLTGYTIGSNTPIVASDTILQAFENLQAQITADTGSAITSLTGDVTATGPGSVASTVAKIQGTAISGTTGTSDVVFSNSPTLITPALGTPSAAILTNATGLPLTTGVTGVLPIANGGTNNNSAYTAGSIIFSNGTSLIQDNAKFYWDDTNFALGINTIPASTVMIDGVNTSGISKLIQMTGYGTGSTTGYRGRFARGTSGSPTAVQSGDILNVISGRGYGASQFAANSTGAINIIAGETFTDTSNETYLQFEVTPTGSVTAAEHMRVTATGMTLGPQSASADLHTVNGGWIRTNKTITATYTVDTTTTDDIILCNQTGAITITLPVPTSGRTIIIKDISGTAQTNNITLASHASEKIEGLAASKSFETNFGSWTISSDGTNWWML